MGALTNTRKRNTIDITSTTPPSKKSKKVQCQSSPINFSLFSPFSRKIHAPQRVIKAFNQKPKSKCNLLRDWNLESPKSREICSLLNRETVKMSNFVSSCYKSKKEEGLGLEDYRKLVDELGFKRVRSDLGLRLELETVKEAKVLNVRKDAGKNAKVLAKRLPVYVELYKKVKDRDARLSSLELELKVEEEKLLGFRLAGKLEEKKGRKDFQELLRPLTDEEENEVLYALHGGHSRHQLLVEHEASNIRITKEVLQCLCPGAWLNDEVINLYFELLKERERREPKKFLKCHFFNTFFYKKLISGRNGYDFKAVRRWTAQKKLGYALVECEKIFVPIHKDIHWCLAVINVRDQTFQYLDSLACMDPDLLRVLARYFTDEVSDKSNKKIDAASWKQEIVDDLPLQENGSDCGMFMLKYIDFYSRGLDLFFSQENMAYFRKRTVMEILRLTAE